LFSLTENLPRRTSPAEFVSIVRDKAKLRKIMGICSSTQARCADQGEDADRIREDMEASLLEVAAEGDSGAVKIGAVTPAVEKKVERSRSITEERTALELTWGLKGLDDLTKGLFGGELTVISGESGGGKTIEAMQITLENAREGTPCAWFSMEMSKEKIVQRCYPALSNILTADMMRDPRLMNLHTHVPEMKKMSAEVNQLPIWIDDTSPLHINKLVARTRMMRRKHGIRLFVCDYLQLIQHSCKTEIDGIRDIVFKLRDLVKSEPTIHIILLSQYSKADGFSKTRKRTKGDLYGGSAIHHAAQNVVLIKVEDPEDKEPNAYLDVEFRIDKQRDGRVGKVPCMLDRSHLRFMHPQPALR
jgi:replicative DNA helicase